MTYLTERPVLTDIPDPWGGRLAPLVFDLLAAGWDAAVAAMCYEDGTPVEIVESANPYRQPTTARGDRS